MSLLVLAVEHGSAAEAWNEANPKRTISLGSKILEANGHRDAKLIADGLEQGGAGVLELVVQAPTPTSVATATEAAAAAREAAVAEATAASDVRSGQILPPAPEEPPESLVVMDGVPGMVSTEQPLSLVALFHRVEAEERARKAAVSDLAEAVAALRVRIDGVAAAGAGVSSLAAPCEQMAEAAERCHGELLEGQVASTSATKEDFTLQALTDRVSKALSCQSLGMRTSPQLHDEAGSDLAERLRRLEAGHAQLGEVVADLSRETRQRTVALRDELFGESPAGILNRVTSCETAGGGMTCDTADPGADEASDGSLTHAPSTRVGTPALPPSILQMPPSLACTAAVRTAAAATDRGTQWTNSGASSGRWTSLASSVGRGKMPPCSGQGGGLSVSSDITQRAGQSIEVAALHAGSKGSSSTGSLSKRTSSPEKRNIENRIQQTCSNSPGLPAAFLPIASPGNRPTVQQISTTQTLHRCVSNGAASPTAAAAARPVGGSAKVYPSWKRPQFTVAASPPQAQVTDPITPLVGSPVLRSYRVPLAGVQASPQQVATGRERAATGAHSPWLWPPVSTHTATSDLGNSPSPRRCSSPAGPGTRGLNSRYSPVLGLNGGTPPTMTRAGSS